MKVPNRISRLLLHSQACPRNLPPSFKFCLEHKHHQKETECHHVPSSSGPGCCPPSTLNPLPLSVIPLGSWLLSPPCLCPSQIIALAPPRAQTSLESLFVLLPQFCPMPCPADPNNGEHSYWLEGLKARVLFPVQPQIQSQIKSTSAKCLIYSNSINLHNIPTICPLLQKGSTEGLQG